MKEFKHFGAYGIIIKDNNILLIKKVSGPYDGLLDLPGGTIEFGEKPDETLKRELKEEVGISVTNYKLLDADSVCFKWKYNEKETIKVHHTAIYYLINSYDGDIKNNIEIDQQNDDSLGAEFYDIDTINKNELSKIALLQLEKLKHKKKVFLK